MATTKGTKLSAKKTPAKKKVEEAVELPKEEVIQAESPAQETLPPELPKEEAPVEVAKVEESHALQEAPSEPKVEEVKEAAVVEQKEEVLPQKETKHLHAAAASPSQPVLGVGSIVVMPNGKQGKVVGIDHKGRFNVSKLSSPRKIFTYQAGQLSLVK